METTTSAEYLKELKQCIKELDVMYLSNEINSDEYVGLMDKLMNPDS